MPDVEIDIDNNASRPIARRQELTDERKQEIREVFELFDSETSGVVEKRQLRVMMRSLGYEPRKDQLARLIVACGISQRATQIKYEEFHTLMEKMINERDIQEEMMHAFSLFDTDESGKITFENLREVADQLGERMTDEELREMIREADMDKDGMVSATEFVRIMKKTSLWSAQ
ncbi:unnamed protein product [Agarophyton chilense]|eukprot:gb/GEZJ01001453.1/.p2 GENE.gb/GEZJ01001453.1/~~gb/GEZJ01001453.1/.p2  ORF type:complete len:174 (-),score=48.84 gb/GEZJ01001453.1/:1661-2182(-)